MMRAAAVVIVCVTSCSSTRPFPLRAPFVVDTDLRPVSVPCRPDPSPKEARRRTCAPREYVSPFLWDHIDNTLFARLSRAFSVQVSGEAVNVNSLDEVPDSAWFTNRRHTGPLNRGAPGACSPDHLLPPHDRVADGAWTVDRGKENGATRGFRIEVPGKGRYLLKADEPDRPERASAASVIGAALYHAIGFNTTCEQIVVIRPSQLALTPGLEFAGNDGVRHPFDERALRAVLAAGTQLPGGLVRLQASRWLDGHVIGPFRYIGTRPDDPNDVIDHADRRELRGNRVLSAWIDHWDAREQNSMDVWIASDPSDARSSPGYVLHYMLDTSDALGGGVSRYPDVSNRLGHSYTVDFADIARSLVTLGVEERPWDRASPVPGREKFGFFRARDFDPDDWKPMYPNPAFLRMTERDAAWMARLIARFSPDDIRRFAALGQWRDPGDVDYLTSILVERQRRILARYLGKLSPLGDVHPAGSGRICATDFARLRAIAPAATFRYSIVERGGGKVVPLHAEVGDGGALCFRTRSVVAGDFAEDDPARIVTIEIHNGTQAGPLVLHGYDLGRRGVLVVGLTRPEALIGTDPRYADQRRAASARSNSGAGFAVTATR